MSFQGQPQPTPGPYGSILLNELHSLFPALLYDRRRFHGVQDLLEYVERQMSVRYDLYSGWRAHYRQQNPLPQRWGTATAATAEPQQDMDTLTQLLMRAMFMPTNITTAVPPMTVPIPNPFWEPVVVAPTTQQIAWASTVYMAPTRLDTPCTICQDTIVEGDSVRKLTHCNHFFHRNCIDTWFLRHVDCPVCRHDIRGQAAGEAAVRQSISPMPPA